MKQFSFISYRLSLLLLFCLYILPIYSQSIIRGSISDQDKVEPIIGAQIAVKDKAIGTVSNLDGEFQLATNLKPPFTLHISAIGFREQEVYISEPEMSLLITLKSESALEERVVVSASRVEERILEAPVSVEKLGVLDLRDQPAADFYTSIGQLKGVMMYPSSLTSQSINTRGFGNVQNWRFVQLIDGIDISGPGVNYGVGSVNKGSELDVRNIEVVSGPGSALYGPNVFNGMLSITTKSPFDYQGLSAYLKQGITRQENVGANPFLDMGLRYAKAFNDRFAFKINLTYLNATDWEANDMSYLITNQDIPFKDELLQIPTDDPNYNAVNIYGDEIQVPVDLGGGNMRQINRTGLYESEIVDYDVERLTFQTSLHYKLSRNVEAVYDFRYARADNIIRYENFYPFTNFENQFHRFEISGNNFFARTYLASDNSGDGYSMLAAGAIIQESLKPSPIWANDYGNAFRGEVPGVLAGDHLAARTFADRDIPAPGSTPFKAARNATLNIPIDIPGGSGVVMKAHFLHTEAAYDFKNEIAWMDIQVGGSFRRYVLDSDGHVYNDGVKGFDDEIPVTEYGFYAQSAKKVLNDRLNLRGSLRYDKNRNFEGRVTPRISAVLSLGEYRQHNFRFSWQTGFRNPANQDTYVAFNAGQLIYLGNIKHNVERYWDIPPNEVGRYEDPRQSPNIIKGMEIYDELVTIQSFQRFMEAGGTDPSLLEPANLEFLEQEKIQAIDVGYRGMITTKMLLDVNMYYNRYENFTANVVSFSPTLGKPILTLNNVPDQVRSLGVGAGVEYMLPMDFKLGANYSFAEFDATEAREKNPNYFPDFNTPKHMFKISLSNRNILERLGFSMNYRWLDDYMFQSPNGQTSVDSYDVLDAAVSIKLPEIHSMLKIGASNVFNETYTPVYGGPTLGTQAYIQITFDEFLR